jgi:lipid A 3-O-deacylase
MGISYWIRICMIIFFSSDLVINTLAQTSNQKGQFAGERTTTKSTLKFESGVGYLIPTHDTRSIHTITGDLLIGTSFFKRTPLSIYTGVTTTYAWGTIVQWDDSFNNVTYENSAFGVGPAFMLRYEPFIWKYLSLSPDFGGSFIFYSNKFPYGGDVYNFMWRMGAAVHYHINSRCALNVNVKWMHVSNGQGLGPDNPSYEAWGLGVAYVKYFR